MHKECPESLSNEVTAHPRSDLLSKCCTIKRRVLCVVTELFPLRVAKSAVQVVILIQSCVPFFSDQWVVMSVHEQASLQKQNLPILITLDRKVMPVA